jgi:hypothetical protein
MTSVLIHDNPHIFPDPHTFTPERWLDAKPGAGDQQRLTNTSSLSAKARAGAWFESRIRGAPLTLANVFRFEMRLFDTVRRDVMSRMTFQSQSEAEFEGMRVTVVGRPP